MGKQWKQWETLFIFLVGGSSKITADSDCCHEIKRCLLLGRKAVTHLDSILNSRDITLPTKVCLVKDMVFPVVMYRCVLEKEMATHSSILVSRILWTKEPGGLLSMGSHRVGHDWSVSNSSSNMYGCESWAIKKTEWQRVDVFELRCWRLLRVPWTQEDPTSPS